MKLFYVCFYFSSKSIVLLQQAGQKNQKKDLRRQRNITSHTYDQLKADSVYQTACDFLNEASRVLAVLSRRNA